MSRLFEPLSFVRGPAMKNRFMLAPLTNTQSHADGTLSDEEFRWLTMRAEGGFGLTMTCAAHVQRGARAFRDSSASSAMRIFPISRGLLRQFARRAAWRSCSCITRVSVRPKI